MKALAWLVTGGLMVASALPAQPLDPLQVRLAALRSDQPIRLKVDVELTHRGSAPLHLNGTKKKGRAIVVYGPHGPEVREQRWRGSSSRLSAWGESKVEVETPLLDPAEAGDLVDPAGMLALLLRGATVLSDEEVTWQNQPARLLVIRPDPLAAERPDEARTAGVVLGIVPSASSPRRRSGWMPAARLGPGTLGGATARAGSPGDATADAHVSTGRGSLAGRQIRGDLCRNGAGGAAQQG